MRRWPDKSVQGARPSPVRLCPGTPRRRFGRMGVSRPTPGDPVIVSQSDIFDSVLLSLNQSMLDDAHWPATSALIDEACGTQGNALLIGDAPEDDTGYPVAAAHDRGLRRCDAEHDDLDSYRPWVERLPRVGHLPDSRVARITDLYSEQELKTSRPYHALSPRSNGRHSLHVRLDGPHGSHVTWLFNDPLRPGGWDSAHIRMIQRLLPHVRQFVQVRLVMAGANAFGNALGGMLNNGRTGNILLDWRGRMVEANERALDILRLGDGLTASSEGALRTWLPADATRFERLLARVLPPASQQGIGGSMAVRRLSGLPSLALHMTPLGGSQATFRPRKVAALLVVVDPVSRLRVDPRLVASTLGLSAAESQVAIALAEGRTVRDMALASGRRENAIRFHLKRIYRRLDIAGQADLVRLVLSLAELPQPRC